VDLPSRWATCCCGSEVEEAMPSSSGRGHRTRTMAGSQVLVDTLEEQGRREQAILELQKLAEQQPSSRQSRADGDLYVKVGKEGMRAAGSCGRWRSTGVPRGHVKIGTLYLRRRVRGSGLVVQPVERDQRTDPDGLVGLRWPVRGGAAGGRAVQPGTGGQHRAQRTLLYSVMGGAAAQGGVQCEAAKYLEWRPGQEEEGRRPPSAGDLSRCRSKTPAVRAGTAEPTRRPYGWGCSAPAGSARGGDPQFQHAVPHHPSTQGVGEAWPGPYEAGRRTRPSGRFSRRWTTTRTTWNFTTAGRAVRRPTSVRYGVVHLSRRRRNPSNLEWRGTGIALESAGLIDRDRAMYLRIYEAAADPPRRACPAAVLRL